MGNKLFSGEAGTGEGKAELGSCLSSVTQNLQDRGKGSHNSGGKMFSVFSAQKEKFKLTENKNESDT